MRVRIPNSRHPLCRLDFKHPDWNKSYMYDSPEGDNVLYADKAAPEGVNEDDVLVEAVFHDNGNRPVSGPIVVKPLVESFKTPEVKKEEEEHVIEVQFEYEIEEKVEEPVAVEEKVEEPAAVVVVEEKVEEPTPPPVATKPLPKLPIKPTHLRR